MTLLHGTIVNRTYDTHKNLYFYVFLPTTIGPIYYGPPYFFGTALYKNVRVTLFPSRLSSEREGGVKKVIPWYEVAPWGLACSDPYPKLGTRHHRQPFGVAGCRASRYRYTYHGASALCKSVELIPGTEYRIVGR